MANIDSVLRNRDITLPTKVCLAKAMVFPVVMYGCESWTQRRMSAKELMLLNCGVGEDSWESLDGKEIKPVNPKGNKSWIVIGRTDAKAETPILWPPDVKSWLIWKIPWCWKRLKAEGEGDDRGWDDWMVSPNSVDMSLSKPRQLMMDRGACHTAVLGVAKSRTWLSELIWEGDRESFWYRHQTDIRRGTESVPLASLRKSYILFQLVIIVNQKIVSRL